jgi:hypothetical protein
MRLQETDLLAWQHLPRAVARGALNHEIRSWSEEATMNGDDAAAGFAAGASLHGQAASGLVGNEWRRGADNLGGIETRQSFATRSKGSSPLTRMLRTRQSGLPSRASNRRVRTPDARRLAADRALRTMVGEPV